MTQPPRFNILNAIAVATVAVGLAGCAGAPVEEQGTVVLERSDVWSLHDVDPAGDELDHFRLFAKSYDTGGTDSLTFRGLPGKEALTYSFRTVDAADSSWGDVLYLVQRKPANPGEARFLRRRGAGTAADLTVDCEFEQIGDKEDPALIITAADREIQELGACRFSNGRVYRVTTTVRWRQTRLKTVNKTQPELNAREKALLENLGPESNTTYLEASALFNAGDLDKSAQLLETCASVGHGGCNQLLGVIYGRQDRFADAIQQYERGVDTGIAFGYAGALSALNLAELYCGKAEANGSKKVVNQSLKRARQLVDRLGVSATFAINMAPEEAHLYVTQRLRRTQQLADAGICKY